MDINNNFLRIVFFAKRFFYYLCDMFTNKTNTIIGRFIISVLLMVVAVSANAQNEQLIVNRIINQLRLFPQEKTYTHTDAADYAPGDRIWLKVYVVNSLSHEPNSESLYAYVELISPQETVEAKAKLLCRDGIYAGYIDIPENAEKGHYCVRSYTDLSSNATDYDSYTHIFIGGKGSRKGTGGKRKEAESNAVADDNLPLKYVKNNNRVTISTTLPENSLTLLVHCRAYPISISPISIDHPVVMSCDSLPEGVISMLLLDRKLNVKAERLMLSVNGSEQCPLTVATDKSSYSRSDSVTLTLKAPALHEGESADISISVTGTTLVHRHRPSSIVASLLLGTDTKQGVDANELFTTDTRRADQLLANEQWTRYDFNRLLHGHYAKPRYECETTHTINGRVKALFRRRPIPEAKIDLISPQAGCLASTTADMEGRFSFTGMDHPEGTQYVMHANDANGKGRVEIVIDNKKRPDFHAPHYDEYDETEGESYEIANDTLVYLDADGIMLENVDVRGRQRKSGSDGNVYSLVADYAFSQRRIEQLGATSIYELLFRIPGLRFEGNKCFIRTASSIYVKRPAIIAVDGNIIPDEFSIDVIPMHDVARVDVFKPGSTVLWGTEGNGGVISVTTKKGNYRLSNVKEPVNQVKISPLGFQLPSDFFSMSGHRKTLYWNPNITTDQIKLKAADTTGDCHVVIEGVTSEGRLIHKEFDIKVE